MALSIMQTEHSTIIEQFITLRTLIGFLGEKNQQNWWDTSFLDKTGQKFLEVNFPRSFLASGINSVSEAARILHDNYIGKGRVYHLFRLPTDIEEKIFHCLQVSDPSLISHLIESKDVALSNLKGFATANEILREGPVQIGKKKKLYNQTVIHELASIYLEAFNSGKKVFPYFTAD